MVIMGNLEEDAVDTFAFSWTSALKTHLVLCLECLTSEQPSDPYNSAV